MKTIYRKRVAKMRVGISNGPCFVGFHYGLRSFYVAKVPCGRLSTGYLKGITDVKGKVEVRTLDHTNYLDGIGQ